MRMHQLTLIPLQTNSRHPSKQTRYPAYRAKRHSRTLKALVQRHDHSSWTAHLPLITGRDKPEEDMRQNLLLDQQTEIVT